MATVPLSFRIGQGQLLGLGDGPFEGCCRGTQTGPDDAVEFARDEFQFTTANCSHLSGLSDSGSRTPEPTANGHHKRERCRWHLVCDHTGRGAGVSQLRKYKPDDAPVLCDSLRGLLQSHGRKRTFVVFECVRTALHG